MMGAMRANLHKDPTQVASMFDEVAQNYDLTNDVLTFGIDRMWRRATFAAVDARPGQRVLDLAAGTGTSSVPYAEAGIDVVPCDFSEGMVAVEVGRASCRETCLRCGWRARCKRHS